MFYSTDLSQFSLAAKWNRPVIQFFLKPCSDVCLKFLFKIRSEAHSAKVFRFRRVIIISELEKIIELLVLCSRWMSFWIAAQSLLGILMMMGLSWAQNSRNLVALVVHMILDVAATICSESISSY